MGRKRVLSGVQPTGTLHLGNWLGAIRNWVDLQHQHDTFFCVVDLHAITVPHDPALLARQTRQTAALYMACGIDPQQATVFVQSHVPAHSELCWLLNCITPLNWLERMIQFKEKASKQGSQASVGLLDYPVLMAADILLYNADLVPVGEDQKQHLELARNIAQQRLNGRFAPRGQTVLNVPEPLIFPEGARVMSLTDGRNKMSKSDPNDNSRINLLDTPSWCAKRSSGPKPMRPLVWPSTTRSGRKQTIFWPSMPSSLVTVGLLLLRRAAGWGGDNSRGCSVRWWWMPCAPFSSAMGN